MRLAHSTSRRCVQTPVLTTDCAFLGTCNYPYGNAVCFVPSTAVHVLKCVQCALAICEGRLTTAVLARAQYPSRAWIDMNALPEVLRYLRIAPVLASDCLVLKAVIGLASRLLAPNLLSWEAALAVLPQALGQVLGRLFYAFPRIREVWNSCPGSGQPAAAMKTHLNISV